MTYMKKIILACMLAGSSAAAFGDKCVTNEGYFFTPSEKVLDTVTQLSLDKDYAALQKLKNAGLLGSFKGGDEVYLAKRHFGGTVEVRVPGDTVIVWTYWEGVNCR